MAHSGVFRVRVPDIDYWKELVPCRATCPVQTDAGQYVQLIAHGEYEQAYRTARAPNPFASICGRVCAAPCEDRCRRGKLDAPVSIRALKRFVTERFGVPEPEPVPRERAGSTRVAVVGAGPAGLACARELARMDYAVTLFEASDSLGGMMLHGIPEFRLSRDVIDKEIEDILRSGVRVLVNAPLSETFGLRELREEGFQAVFLSIGTQRGREIAVEGATLSGIINAIDFLRAVNHGRSVELGARVVVIGGGFVAFDAARSALRLGAPEVSIVSLESLEEMPALRSAQGREEFHEAAREGVRFVPQRGARRFAGSNGRVEAVELIGVRRTYDENGRFAPVYESDIHEITPADTVILAVGQQADLSFLKPEDGVELTPQRTIKIDPATLATTAPGVFAGGDAAFGPRNLIEAVANGKRAARSIDEYVSGCVGQRSVFRLSTETIPIRTYRTSDHYELQERQAPPTVEVAQRNGCEVELSYDEPEARRQAARCLRCHIQTIYSAEKCVLCGRCVDVCPEACLKLVPFETLAMDEEARSGLSSFYDIAGEVSTAMIKDDEKCIRCGLCARRCPTGALTMEIFSYHEELRPAS